MLSKKRGLILVLLGLFLVFSAFAEPITCATATGCEFMEPDACSAANGREVSDAEYDLQCQSVCCKLANDQFCSLVPTQVACQQIAVSYGGSIIANPLTNNPQHCQVDICEVVTEAGSLTINVKDVAGNPIAAGAVTLNELTPTPGEVGTYVFSTLTPGSYVLTVSHVSLQAQTLTVEITTGQDLTREIILQGEVGKGRIEVKVLEQGDTLTPSRDASVTISPSVAAIPGEIRMYEDVPQGVYRITASKPGFQPASRQVAVSAGGDERVELLLIPAPTQTINGQVFKDVNENNVKDAGEEALPGINVFLNGNKVAKTQLPSLTFEILSSIPDGTHVLTASYEGGVWKGEVEFTKSGDSNIPINIPLLRQVGECEPGSEQPPEDFTYTITQGKPQFTFTWRTPCDEVSGYIFTKEGPGGITTTELGPEITTLIEDVEWDATYTYTLSAVYPGLTDFSGTSTSIPGITPGSVECANHYADGDWEIFCRENNPWTCTPSNNLVQTQTCEEGRICAPTGPGQAGCKEITACDLLDDLGQNPFGLYYDRDSCYGSKNAETSADAVNYCFYEQTESVVDHCVGCSQAESCYKYQSKDACEINSCLTDKCAWVDAGQAESKLVDYSDIFRALDIEYDIKKKQTKKITPETGTGFCVEENYELDDTCNLCAPGSELFENFLCTADICTNLGRCLSDNQLQACHSCGILPERGTTCDSYVTELECTGGQDIQMVNGEIFPAKDRCGWERCAWKSGSCFKDSDVDGVSDCDALEPGLQPFCKQDITPPITTVKSFSGLPTVSTVNQEMQFIADDTVHTGENQKSDLTHFGYCVEETGVDVGSTCTAFTTIPYPVNTRTSEMSANILDVVGDKEVQAEVMRVLFYSQDKQKNRESARATYVLVDNVLPAFTIKWKNITETDTVSLIAWLEDTNEPMSCSFTLEDLSDPSNKQVKFFTLEESKQVSFAPLVEVIWAQLNVSCEDRYGNPYSQVQKFTFNLDSRISINKPRGTVSSTTLEFDVSTTVNAVCSLYNRAGKVMDFSSDNNRHHVVTPPLSFPVGDYFQEYSVQCQELANIEEFMTAHFDFTVDTIPPKTKVTLVEGPRTIKPLRPFWSEIFVEEAQVTLECVEEGVPCTETLYCLGDCSPFPTDEYQIYTGTLSITESTNICYFSRDEANNPVYSASCGEIRVEGYGIIHLSPKSYTYLDDTYLISSFPEFDWTFTTNVPTKECRVGFEDGFDYSEVPAYQKLLPNAAGVYGMNFPTTVFRAFPETGGIFEVFIKCANMGDEIGPEDVVFMEYDPLAPEILEAYAIPDELYEGDKVELYVATNSKTLCKFGDDLEGTGSREYETMEFSFPGQEENALERTHQAYFKVNDIGPTGRKEFTLNTQCTNGGGNLSKLSQINFLVDLANLGFIRNVYPDGDSFSVTDIPLAIETSKSATCQVKLNESYTPFPSTGGTTHEAALFGLGEGDYIIPTRCTFSGGHTMEQDLTFNIDLTAPKVSKVSATKYTCGQEKFNVLVYTDEPNITTYHYEVFREGNSSRIPVLQGTSDVGSPIGISSSNLTLDKSYVVKVKAVDAAGHISEEGISNRFLATNANYSLCADTDTPGINFVINDSSCTKSTVELHCIDILGCVNMTYGKHLNEVGCNLTTPYGGQKLSVKQDTWVCYTASDAAGNVLQGQKKINFLDADSDKVRDKCDLCASTDAGKVVDSQGCGFGEVPKNDSEAEPWEVQGGDSDGDSLPDLWEQMYNSLACLLDLNAPDSDFDGLPDGIDDNDGDGYTNYDEYLATTDPCSDKDVPLSPDDEDPDSDDDTIRLPPGSKGDTGPDYIALGILVLGILMMGGGIGYLIYFYGNQAPTRPLTGVTPAGRATPGKPIPKGPSPLKRKYLQFRKSRDARRKTDQRKGIFSSFSPTSKKIPHLETALKKEGTPAEKITAVAKEYVKHKETIRPGLKPAERSTFDQLESLAGKAQGRSVGEIVSGKKVESIFGKLKKISKERKNE